MAVPLILETNSWVLESLTFPASLWNSYFAYYKHIQYRYINIIMCIFECKLIVKNLWCVQIQQTVGYGKHVSSELKFGLMHVNIAFQWYLILWCFIYAHGEIQYWVVFKMSSRTQQNHHWTLLDKAQHETVIPLSYKHLSTHF